MQCSFGSLNVEFINGNVLEVDLFLAFIEVIGANFLGKVSKMLRLV